MKSQNKRVIGYVGKQEQLLIKFRETGQFFENVREIKSTVYFKIGIYKLYKWRSTPHLKNQRYLLITFRRILKLLRKYVKTTQTYSHRLEDES